MQKHAHTMHAQLAGFKLHAEQQLHAAATGEGFAQLVVAELRRVDLVVRTLS